MFVKKLAILTIFLLIFMTISQAVYAEGALNQWKYSKDISIIGENKYKTVAIDDETYKYALPDLSDIRVVDSKGAFVPYFIKNGFPLDGAEETDAIYESTPMDRFTEGDFTVIDFAINMPDGTSEVTGNKLLLDVLNDSYLKPISIYGSRDNSAWDYITKGTIYKSVNVTKNEVAFEKTVDYIYYRVKISDSPEKVKIGGMQLAYSDADAKSGEFAKTGTLKYDIKTEGKNTLIDIDNSNRLKIRSIKVDVDGNYTRDYSIYTRTNNAFDSIGKSGQIYNLKIEDTTVDNPIIEFGSSPILSESIEVRLDNQEEKPLDIKGVTVEYYVDKIVFEDIGNKPYKLYFGNMEALYPNYDIEKDREQIDNEKQDVCSLGKVVAHKGAAKDVSEQGDNKFLYRILIIGAEVLALLAVIIFVLKQRKGRRRARRKKYTEM